MYATRVGIQPAGRCLATPGDPLRAAASDQQCEIGKDKPTF
jgi:hypothetical protein